MRGLRAKVRGEGRGDRWGHALTRAHARVRHVGGRTDSTCSLHLMRGQKQTEWQWPGFRAEAVKSAVAKDRSNGRQG